MIFDKSAARRVLALIMVALGSAAASAGRAQSPIGVISGPPAALYAGARSACGADDGIDAPARAFRDAAGRIHLFAANDRNRQFVGPDLQHLSHPCGSAFAGGHNSDPQAYDDHGWLASFYTQDGLTIHAIIHNEYHGGAWAAACRGRDELGCWETSLTAAVSTDGGNTFQRLPGAKGVAAAYPWGYDPSRADFYGYLNPTNIIEAQHHLYVFFGLHDPVDRQFGVSAMRTCKATAMDSWCGWDGSDFTVAFKHPSPMSDAAKRALRIIAPPDTLFGIGSVSLHKPTQTYVATLRRNVYGATPHGLAAGVYLATSKDLVHWSAPALLLSDADARGAAGDPTQKEFYPALIDPNGGDANFQDITDKPVLITVRIVPGTPLEGRKLLAWPVTLHLGPQ